LPERRRDKRYDATIRLPAPTRCLEIQSKKEIMATSSEHQSSSEGNRSRPGVPFGENYGVLLAHHEPIEKPLKERYAGKVTSA
jgi:hypothetical protein